MVYFTILIAALIDFVLLEIMFEEKSLTYVQRKIQNILEVHYPHLFLKAWKTANLLQVIFWQNPTQFPSLLSPVYAGLILSPQHPEPPASWAPSFLSPQLPASAFCALFSDLKIEVNSYIQEGMKKPSPSTSQSPKLQKPSASSSLLCS